MTFRFTAAVLVGVGLAALTGCGGAGAGSGSDAWPAGRTFLSTEVTESGAARPLIEGTRVELRFGDDGRVAANAGCNHMSGTGRVESNVLVVEDLATTDMGCPDGRNDQDTWVAGLLTGKPVMRIEGDQLTLTAARITMTLTDRRVADPDRPLIGTRWVVDTIFASEVASSVPPEAPAVLVVDQDGRFQASTGCVGGQLQGPATISAGQLDLTVTDDQPCVGSGNALDAAIRATLRGRLSYEITAGRLRLSANGHGLGLRAEE